MDGKVNEVVLKEETMSSKWKKRIIYVMYIFTMKALT